MTVNSAASRAANLSALSNVAWAAIIGLIGAILSLVELFARNTVSLLGVSAGTMGTSLSLNLSALYFVAALAAAGIAFGLAEIWLYRRAFRRLTPLDTNFRTPASLALVAMISLIIVVLIGVALLVLLYQAFVCAGAGNPIATACLSGDVLGLVGLLVLVGIVGFIGYVGVAIGIWRLGTRYGEGMFKAGAILIFFPLLNVVGLLLILIAARSTRARIESGSPMPIFG